MLKNAYILLKKVVPLGIKLETIINKTEILVLTKLYVEVKVCGCVYMASGKLFELKSDELFLFSLTSCFSGD